MSIVKAGLVQLALASSATGTARGRHELLLPPIAPPTLVDHPIASGVSPLYLDGSSWTATNTPPPGSAVFALAINATVPGDVLSDLQRAGHVPDPYFNTTWRGPGFIRRWNAGTWTYRRVFPWPRSPEAHPALLVFDGVRMGAMVALNGVHLGNCTDQWLRYQWHVPAAQLLPTHNVLTVTFGGELMVATGGRSTVSNDIDWAPVMATKDPTDGRPTFGFGICRSVYLLPLPDRAAAITQFVPHTFYAGGHPTTLLSDTGHAGFNVSAAVDLLSNTGCSGTLRVAGTWPGALPESQKVTLAAGVSTITLTLGAEQTLKARLWQPNGNGDQVRYAIEASFTPDGSGGRASRAAATTSRMVGFRHAVLVTTNDTDAATRSAARKQDGSGQLTMFLRVNGAPVYARGGNKVCY